MTLDEIRDKAADHSRGNESNVCADVQDAYDLGCEHGAIAVRATGLGVAIGVNDMDGNPVHIGDTLAFDPVEWYRNAGPDTEVIVPVLTTVELVKGQITCKGGTGSIKSWCKIVKRWDES